MLVPSHDKAATAGEVGMSAPTFALFLCHVRRVGKKMADSHDISSVFFEDCELVPVQIKLSLGDYIGNF